MDEFIIDIQEWDDVELPLKKAKQKLNEYLAFDILPN